MSSAGIAAGPLASGLFVATPETEFQ